MNEAFSKLVELVSIPNKEAETVANAIFYNWICRYGVPMEIITDHGKEFCNKLSKEFCKLLELKHGRTYRPQCNAQVEVGNKTIAKYLRNKFFKIELGELSCTSSILIQYLISQNNSNFSLFLYFWTTCKTTSIQR